ncbi:MAG: FISUMP domain-containing protein [Bacteroidota bacterium]
MKRGNITYIIGVLILSILFTLNCKKLEIVELTKIKTGTVDEIGVYSASVKSTFIDVSSNVTEYGHCWSTEQNPTIDNFKEATKGAAPKGLFTNQLSELEPGTGYFIRPYAIDDGEILYGAPVFFETLIMPLSIHSPNSGSVWAMASKQSISWSEDIIGNITLILRKDGEFIRDIIEGVPADNKQFDWFVPVQLEAGIDYSVEIISEDDGNIFHESDFFTINAQETGEIEYYSVIYPTIKIGEQWWIAKNLMTTSYADGTPLTDGMGVGDITGDYLTRYYFAYDDDYVNEYGRLYTWAAAMKGSVTEGVQGVCPDGWHVPTDLEWKQLSMELGMPEEETGVNGWHGTDEGGKLKETGTTHWNSPNTGANNESGFLGLPGGIRLPYDIFSFSGIAAVWWQSTEDNFESAWGIHVDNDKEGIFLGTSNKSMAASVRCIKGEGALYINTTFIDTHWEMGTFQDITWTDNIDENVNIDLYIGDTYTGPITGNFPGNGVFGWDVPTDLDESKEYRIRVSSVNDNELFGFSHPFEISAATGTTGTTTDFDGNEYTTIKIGLQWWMAENLKVTTYADNSAIPLTANNTEWGSLGDNNIDDAYCYYNDNTGGEAAKYGALYTWAAAMGDNAESSDSNPSGVQGICPNGWHLPGNAEWKQLEMYLGMSESQANEIDWRGTDEGGKLKEAGIANWNDPNDASNESGFTALPGGRRDQSGGFNDEGGFAFFWCATEDDGTNGLRRRLWSGETRIELYPGAKSSGFSVRCVRD